MSLPLEMFYGIGALILLLALVWGVRQVKTRNRANDPVTEEATRDIYDHDTATYDAEREELKKQIRPS